MSINISDKFIDSTAKETCILEMTSSKPIIDKLSKYLTSFLLTFNIFILFNPHNGNRLLLSCKHPEFLLAASITFNKKWSDQSWSIVWWREVIIVIMWSLPSLSSFVLIKVTWLAGWLADNWITKNLLCLVKKWCVSLVMTRSQVDLRWGYTLQSSLYRHSSNKNHL